LPDSRPSTPPLHLYLLELGIVALITAAAMRLGQTSGLLRGTGLSAIWPATGVNIAMMFLRGRRIWPGIAAGSILDNTVMFGGVHYAIALLAPIADTIEPLLAVTLYRRAGGSRRPFARGADALRYIILCAGAAPLAAAALGVLLLHRIPGFLTRPPLIEWIAWCIPSVVGALVLGPAIIDWSGRPRPPSPGRRWLHAAGIVAGILAVQFALFAWRLDDHWVNIQPLVFLVLPFVVWAALVFGSLGGALATLVASVIATLGTVRGIGPFSGAPGPRSLLVLQLYLAVLALVSMLIAAAIEERAAAYRSLAGQTRTIQLLFDELNHRVRNNLASLLSLIDLSRGSAGDVDRFAGLISGRVRAMADVHSILASDRWSATSIAELIACIAPPELLRRVRLDGPSVQVPPQQAMALGLVVHELITNSIKHGALGSSDGTVELAWAAQDATPEHTTVRFTWREHPSSRVEPAHPARAHPHHNGDSPHRSGLDLIDGLLRADLRGHVEFSFPPNGAVHRFEVRLAAAQSPA
jgi:two-component sensor histidine kinase/integral membrane sensor domain MASE1